MHDEEADRRNERKAEINAGGLDALVVMPPSLELKTKWLVSTIAKAEYLPVMDSNIVGGAGGGDFFVQASFDCIVFLYFLGGGRGRGKSFPVSPWQARACVFTLP